MSEEEKEPQFTDAIEYEKYCDTVFLRNKQGMVALFFAQGIDVPPKAVARIWMDAFAFKLLCEGLQDYLKDYEKRYGEIKLEK